MATSNSTTTIQTVFNIEPYDSRTQWKRWVSRLEGAFEVFDVPADKKVHYLLHYMGPDTYDIVCDKLAPQKPTSKAYNELVDLLSIHFCPEPLEIAENYRFHLRKQHEGESIQDFITALHKLAIYCKFGSHLKTALRNQFVFGLRSERIQSRLLEMKDLTLDKALEIASSIEMSARDAALLHQGNKGATGSSAAIGAVTIQRPIKKKSKDKQNSHYNTNTFSKTNKNTYCFRCGSPDHLANTCNKINATCNFCRKKGHLQSVCSKRKNKGNTNQIECWDILGDANQVEIRENGNPGKNIRDKIWMSVFFENREVKMEFDSGAAVSVISAEELASVAPHLKIMPSNLQLISYSDNILKVTGQVQIEVNYKSKSIMRNLYVVTNRKNGLIGREWIRPLRIQIPESEYYSNESISQISTDNSAPIQKLLETYNSLFDDKFGKVNGIQAELKIKDNVSPVFFKARPVPFALLSKVENEIESLVQEGVLEKVETSRWASPIVPVHKTDSNIRICGDFKVSINPYLLVDEHPLPTMDELLASMAGGDKFTKIDLSKAYLQLEVRPEDRHLLTLNTHKGLYQCTRLMYGVASAPAIWQREIEKILKGIPGVCVFLDDIKITGPDDLTHLQRLELVLKRLEKYNLKINLRKSVFFANEIEYCGYKIDRNGVHKSIKKIQAINEMPHPTNKKELKALLGLVNYYGRFLEQSSTVLYPLNKLLRNDVKFIWNKNCEDSFNKVKKEMSSDSFLVHYDSKLPLILATDASPYGVSAILSHICADGVERPICYASQTLSRTQQKYAQIDKEAYGIIFGVRKFYQYIYGRKFTLYTDCRPLLQIFSTNKSLPLLTASRMQHYAIFLQAFQYDIKYKNTELHANADALSRLPINSKELETFDIADVVDTNQISTLPVTVKQLAKETQLDSTLLPLLQGLKTGKQIPNKLRFNIDQTEFTLQQNCIMRGLRVVIPQKLRKLILDELHVAHFGITKMKLLARSYCWWPNIDNNLESLVKDCYECNKNKNNPIPVSHHWEYPNAPFDRVHIDFAGPFLGMYYFVMVDAYSKWPEIHLLNNITASNTITICQKLFASYGLPRTVVTDNGTQFTSYEFESFLKRNGIKHKFSAPYNPSTNGQAERFVQILKNSLSKMKCNKQTVEFELNKLLLQYRKMPHCTTNLSPARLFLNREIRSRLDLIQPNDINVNSNYRTIEIGARVIARNYTKDQKWCFGKIIKKLGHLHYLILLDNGVEWRRHLNQIVEIGKNCPTEPKLSISNNPVTLNSENLNKICNNYKVTETRESMSKEKSSCTLTSNIEPEIINTPKNINENTQTAGDTFPDERATELTNSEGIEPLRRSQRERRPPNRLNYN